MIHKTLQRIGGLTIASKRYLMALEANNDPTTYVVSGFLPSSLELDRWEWVSFQFSDIRSARHALEHLATA